MVIVFLVHVSVCFFSYPDKQLYNNIMSLSGCHVQRCPVHLGASISADTGSEKDVSGGVVAMLSR